MAPDDQTLVPALEAIGVETTVVIWSDSSVEWRSFDAVILRSCWDYHLRIDEFRSWLARLETAGVATFNSPSLIRWNADKRYLLDLARRGVATIPTMVVSGGAANDVARVAAAEGWPRVVIKPAVSASGYETYALDAPLDPGASAIAGRVASLGDTLVQPFAPEVPRDGEYSFTFLDGEFSHATIKRAAPTEFRVQTEHGGSVGTIEPPLSLVTQAAAVLRALPEVPLYARVDGIARESAFLLMELELIEPNLFLEFGSGAAERLARAIERRLR